MTSGFQQYKAAAKAALAVAAALICGAAMAEPIKVSSTSFKENGMIAPQFAGDGQCGGKNVSPQVAWMDLPAATKSVAVMLFDPDGALGLGVAHWVAYNIDPARREIKEGEASAPSLDFALGKNSAGATAYRGMCPPVGDLSHHYVLTVIATDLAPSALPTALSRDELLAALKGHALGGQSTIGLYSR